MSYHWTTAANARRLIRIAGWGSIEVGKSNRRVSLSTMACVTLFRRITMLRNNVKQTDPNRPCRRRELTTFGEPLQQHGCNAEALPGRG